MTIFSVKYIVIEVTNTNEFSDFAVRHLSNTRNWKGYGKFVSF